MSVPGKYAGEHVQCPNCLAMLHIPSADEDQTLIRWFCSCGQRLKARPKAAGRQTECPQCGAHIKVPFVPAHDSFIEEKFLLDDESGIVQLAPEEGAEKPSAPKTAGRGPGQEVESEPPEDELAPLELAPLPEHNVEEPILRGDEEVLSLEGMEIGAPPEEESGVYQLDAAQGSPLRSAAAVPAKAPSGIPVAPRVQARGIAYADEDEGIRASELSRYFNARGGVEAARSGFTQVLSGYWLYIPYALLAGCMSNIAVLLKARTEGQPILAIALSVLPFLFTLYLYAAFVGCIKDGVFERYMGIERMLYHGVKHFLRFTGTVLIMIPVAIGLGIAGVAAVGGAWALAPGILMKLLVVAATAAGGLFFLVYILIPPIVSILEETNPLFAVGRGLLFGLKNIWNIITLTVISLVVVFIACMVWWFLRIPLWMMLHGWPWLFETVQLFVGGLLGAMLLGLLTASIMVLYLSDLSEEQLHEIRSKLRGPQPVPWRLHVAIGILAVALVGVSYARDRSAGHFRWTTGTSGEGRAVEMEDFGELQEQFEADVRPAADHPGEDESTQPGQE